MIKYHTVFRKYLKRRLELCIIPLSNEHDVPDESTLSRITNAMTGPWIRSLGDRDKVPSAESTFRR